MFNKFKNKNYQSGQAVLVSVLFLTIVSVVVTTGLVKPAVASLSNANKFVGSRAAYYTAEAGVEDVIYRLKNGLETPTSGSVGINGGNVNFVITDDGQDKIIEAVGVVDNLYRKITTSLSVGGSGAAFNYGIQVGEGGFIMENSSQIIGSLYANGPVYGYNSAVIRGDVVSAGPDGLIQGVHATGSAYAHTISGANIEKDAYYQSISGSTVGGTTYPGSADQAAYPFPVTDEQIEEWKAVALAGGVVSSPCPYEIKAATTIGPIKIDCDLDISGNNYDITIAGPVWVSGSINISNSPTVIAADSLGNQSVAIIADKESNRLSSSKVELQNSTIFSGNGQPKSYIGIFSQNNSAENNGSEVAIFMKNSVSGDIILYSGHGKIQLDNSGDLTQLTAHTIHMKNTATVVYEQGIASLLFTSGPTGGYQINSWSETP